MIHKLELRLGCHPTYPLKPPSNAQTLLPLCLPDMGIPLPRVVLQGTRKPRRCIISDASVPEMGCDIAAEDHSGRTSCARSIPAVLQLLWKVPWP